MSRYRQRSARWSRGTQYGSGLPVGFSLVTSVSCLQWVQADLGTTVVGGFVTSWLDQTTNAKDFTQPTGGVQPTYLATGVNGRPALQFLASNWMTSSLTRLAAGANNTWIFSLFRVDTWSAVGSNDIVYTDTAGAGATLIGDALTPNLRMQMATSANVNGGATVGSWVRSAQLFTGSVSDYSTLGASKVSGTNAGAVNAVFAVAHKLGFSSANRTMRHTLAAHGVFAGEPTAGEQSALAAWAQLYGGAGVLI